MIPEVFMSRYLVAYRTDGASGSAAAYVSALALSRLAVEEFGTGSEALERACDLARQGREAAIYLMDSRVLPGEPVIRGAS